MTLDEFFADQPVSRALFYALLPAIEALGPVDMAVTKSQVAFHRGKQFAWVWMPGQYLRRKAAPLVLSLSFKSRAESARWKEIVEPAPGRFMHHLELYSAGEIDSQVEEWLRLAWQSAE